MIRSLKYQLAIIVGTATVAAAACGGGEPTVAETPTAAGPVSVRVLIVDVNVSDDGETVRSITLRTQEGEEFRLRLSDDIDPLVWNPRHLQGHQQTRTQIGVTYLQTAEGKVVTELTE